MSKCCQSNESGPLMIQRFWLIKHNVLANRRSDLIHPAIEKELAILDGGLIQPGVVVDVDAKSLLATKENRDRITKAGDKIAKFYGFPDTSSSVDHLK